MRLSRNRSPAKSKLIAGLSSPAYLAGVITSVRKGMKVWIEKETTSREDERRAVSL
jgi:hypothetical protein